MKLPGFLEPFALSLPPKVARRLLNLSQTETEILEGIRASRAELLAFSNPRWEHFDDQLRELRGNVNSYSGKYRPFFNNQIEDLEFLERAAAGYENTF